jgi:hypothetical protein
MAKFGKLLKHILGLKTAGRRCTVFPDDRFLVSYPRSGNTWTRFLLANLLYPEREVGFANINRLFADPAVATNRYLTQLPRPRLLKSHEPFDHRIQRVVYLVRDPRDVALSEYYFNLKKRYIEPGFPLKQFVRRFIAGQTASYGSWGEHVGSWIGARYRHPSFHLVRYEDLISDPFRETTKIALFLGIPADMGRIRRAIERSSADEMRKLERQQFKFYTGTRNTRQDIPFVREAKSGGWEQNLPQTLAADIEAAWLPLMRFLGYELHDVGYELQDECAAADSLYACQSEAVEQLPVF